MRPRMRIAEMRLTGLFFAVAFAEPSMDLGTGAVAKEVVDRRVEREEVEDELKDLQHLVKTRGYIAQLEQDVKGLRDELGSAGPDNAEAPGIQGGGGMEGDNICPSPTLAGRKRQRGESDVHGREDAGKSMCAALGGPRKAPSHDSADQELPGVCLPAFLPTDGDLTHFCSIPEGNRRESRRFGADDSPHSPLEIGGADLGSGPRWDLRPGMKQTLRAKDMDALKQENNRLLKRCEAMLEQALSGSEHGDVRFVLEDGSSPLSGHRAVLCAVSEEYAGMFRSGMVEGKEGKIRVSPGVSLQAYRGLLEFVYLGENHCESGRFMFVLRVMMHSPVPCSPVFVFMRASVCFIFFTYLVRPRRMIVRRSIDPFFDLLRRKSWRRVRQGRRTGAVGARGVVRGGGDAGLAAG